MFQKLKGILNSIVNPTSHLDNDPFWNPPKIDKYDFVSREERRDTLEILKHKYPKFRRAYRLHEWIGLWNDVNIKDEEFKKAFLRHFEDAIKELEETWEE